MRRLSLLGWFIFAIGLAIDLFVVILFYGFVQYSGNISNLFSLGLFLIIASGFILSKTKESKIKQPPSYNNT